MKTIILADFHSELLIEIEKEKTIVLPKLMFVAFKAL